MEQARNQVGEAVPDAGAHPRDLILERHRRRTALWRAIAGMAGALVLAGLIVGYDISNEVIHSSSGYRTKIAELKKKVKRLSEHAEETEVRLAAARKELAARNKVQDILLAPDTVTIAMSAADKGDSASGTVALSRKAGAGIFKGSGLNPPASGQVYDLWWIMRKTPPAKAGEFRSQPDGSALAYLDLPAAGEQPVGCEITLEQSQGSIEPSGTVKLKARMPR